MPLSCWRAAFCRHPALPACCRWVGPTLLPSLPHAGGPGVLRGARGICACSSLAPRGDGKGMEETGRGTLHCWLAAPFTLCYHSPRYRRAPLLHLYFVPWRAWTERFAGGRIEDAACTGRRQRLVRHRASVSRLAIARRTFLADGSNYTLFCWQTPSEHLASRRALLTWTLIAATYRFHV